MHALGRRGIAVPGDVAVAGFDDIPVARHLHPPLTTVRQSLRQMGACAFDLLHARISAGRGEPDVVFPVQLVVRESCGCAHDPPQGANDVRESLQTGPVHMRSSDESAGE
jgi:LacI family transcriptional regulator